MKLKIALLGYGKMGKAIEQILLHKGHTVVARITEENKQELPQLVTKETTDVAIEFTSPESAVENILYCFKASVPVVCGSTGWLQQLPQVTEALHQQQGTLLYASNFSIGVNLFFAFNAFVAQKMSAYSAYNVAVHEIHHTAKKDAPSGTGITIAEGILQAYPHKTHWVNAEAKTDQELTLTSERVDPAPGTHIVTYKSDIDTIELSHTAHSREGFAQGAVLAAEFLANKKGLFTMADVLAL